MQKIVTFFSYDGQAEDAARYYISIFKNAEIKKVVHYPASFPKWGGKVMIVEFTLEGQEFIALNGAPVTQFSPATSFYVKANTQEEIDHFWDKLGDGGVIHACGWLTDKFGLTWQIVPQRLVELNSSPDPAVAARVMQAMMTMKKIDLALIEAAAKG